MRVLYVSILISSLIISAANTNGLECISLTLSRLPAATLLDLLLLNQHLPEGRCCESCVCHHRGWCCELRIHYSVGKSWVKKPPITF